MRIPGSRTRARLAFGARAFLFDAANIQSMLDIRDKHALEDAMGFRGQWEDHRAFQFDLLKRQGLMPDHRLLEIGCGPLTAAIPIIEYLDPNRYIGVDVRPSVLNLAWRELSKAGLSEKNPRLVCSKSFGDDALEPHDRFDFVYSFSVLFHLSDDLLDSYFEHAARRLAPDGRCIANINDHLDSDRWLEFPFLRRTVDTYAAVASKHGLSTENVGTIENLGFSGKGIERLNPLLIFTLT